MNDDKCQNDTGHTGPTGRAGDTGDPNNKLFCRIIFDADGFKKHLEILKQRLEKTENPRYPKKRARQLYEELLRIKPAQLN